VVTIDLSSYAVAFEKFAPNFLNTLYLVISATFLSALLGAMNGYVLSNWKFKGVFVNDKLSQGDHFKSEPILE